MPEAEPMVATAVLLLDQEPNGVTSVSVVLDPPHIEKVPEMADGLGLMYTQVDTRQLVGSVYVISTESTRLAVTRPPEVTEAMDGLRLAHVPEGVASVNSELVPAHINGNPEISAGSGLTVTGQVT